MNQPVYSDDAKRVSDEMALHAIAKSRGWAIFALADGRPFDHTPYESWSAAVKATKWDRDNYMYCEIQPDGMPLREAEGVLKYARTVHKMGHRIPSPDWEGGPLSSMMPMRSWDRKAMARQLASGKPLATPGDGWGNTPVKSDLELPPGFRR